MKQRQPGANPIACGDWTLAIFPTRTHSGARTGSYSDNPSCERSYAFVRIRIGCPCKPRWYYAYTSDPRSAGFPEAPREQMTRLRRLIGFIGYLWADCRWVGTSDACRATCPCMRTRCSASPSTPSFSDVEFIGCTYAFRAESMAMQFLELVYYRDIRMRCCRGLNILSISLKTRNTEHT